MADLGESEQPCHLKFDELCSKGLFFDAAQFAATVPGGVLRTPETIRRLKQAYMPPGHQGSPLMQYFNVLLKSCKLDKHEAVELAQAVLEKGEIQLIKILAKQDKLECSEELSELFETIDPELERFILLKAKPWMAKSK